MKPLTINLLTKNNEETLRACLDSVMPLRPRLAVADLGSDDRTVEICRSYGASVFAMTWDGDFSRLRNELAARTNTEWQFWLDPWEELAGGGELVEDALHSDGPYRIYILRDEQITKETRIWRKGAACFRRPAFESVEPSGLHLPVIVRSAAGWAKETAGAVAAWAARHQTPGEVDYYVACTLLADKRYDDFIRKAERYLHAEASRIDSVFLSHYYLGVVQLKVKKNVGAALNHALVCVASHPTVAEFWCLLGDVELAMGHVAKARTIYRNAVDLGARRTEADGLPIDLTKYGEYPDRMTARCDDLIREIRTAR